MLDVVFPVTRNNVGVACVSLDALLLNTNVDLRVIAVLDGGKRTEYAALENDLRRSGKDWVAIHSAAPVHFNKCVVDAMMQKVVSDRVAILVPGVVINDKSWFMKMCLPFGKDRYAGMTIAGPVDTQSTTLPPHKLKSLSLSYPFHRLSIIKDWAKLKCQDFSPPNDKDAVSELVTWMMKHGCSVWRVPSVNYQIVDHKAHALS